MYRVCERPVSQGPVLVNQTRGLVAKYEIVLAQGRSHFTVQALEAVADASLSCLACKLFESLFDHAKRNVGRWSVSFDPRAHEAALGGELLLSEALALRGGATWDATAHQWWLSAGIGIITERGGLQVVWRRRVEGPYDQFFEGGLTIYLE